MKKQLLNRLLVAALTAFPVGLLSAEPLLPNIIMIVVDDLGYADLSCTGLAKDVQTPNIDKLAKQGVRFTNAYAAAPICNAARVALMTGAYQQRQGQYWYSGPGLSDKKWVTIAELLKQQGYVTGYIGKFHYGDSDKPDKRGFPLNHGFDEFYGFAGGTKHYLHHKRTYQKKSGRDMLYQDPMWVQDKHQDVDGFTTELFGEQARVFIQKHKPHPFFLTVSFNAVHNFVHQLPETYLKEKGLKGCADYKPGEDYWKWRQKIAYPALAEGRDYYLGQLYFLDREIGLLRKELEKQGLTKNTAIVCVSDNGGSLVTYAKNGELKGGKYTLFEGGTRVPMIFSYPPKYKTDLVSDKVVSAMDILPTICRLTDAPTPANVDGVDLSPLLSGEVVEPTERSLFWDTKAQQSVRQGKWKLLITKKTPNAKLQIVETPKGSFLYNLEKDPGESVNVSSKHPEIVERLTRSLLKWQLDCR